MSRLNFFKEGQLYRDFSGNDHRVVAVAKGLFQLENRWVKHVWTTQNGAEPVARLSTWFDDKERIYDARIGE